MSGADFPALLLAEDEAANVLRTTTATVRELVAAGRLPAVRLTPTSEPRFRPGDLISLTLEATA